MSLLGSRTCEENFEGSDALRPIFRRYSSTDAARGNFRVVVFEGRSHLHWLAASNDERWEVLYRANNDLYKSQVFATRVLAEHDLMRTKDALEATGWRPSGVNVEKGGDA
jgi:hypothetical protein